MREVKSSFRPEVFSITLESLTKELPLEWIVKGSDNSYHFSLPLSGKTPNELLSELMQYGQVKQFEEVIASMEEIFIHQIKSANYE